MAPARRIHLALVADEVTMARCLHCCVTVPGKPGAWLVCDDDECLRREHLRLTALDRVRSGQLQKPRTKYRKPKGK